MRGRAILVLGMHRSGTSALAGVLARLGVHPPRTLMAANEHNPLGFWESERFREFHDRLLHENGTRWDAWTRLVPPDDRSGEERTADEFRTLVEDEYGSAPLFFVKDPRICRIVPFWLHHLRANSIEASAVCILRSPLEIARSLNRRDGLGIEHSLLLWLRHALDAELETRTIPRSFVHYSDLLTNWRQATTKIANDLGIEYPLHADRADADITAFLRPQLRHHVVGLDILRLAAPLDQWIAPTHAALEALLSADPACLENARRTLDEIRSAFDRTADLFGHLMLAARHEQQRRNDQTTAELTRHASNLELEHATLTRHAAALELRRKELERHAVALENHREELRRHATNLEAEWQESRRHSANLEAERVVLRQQFEHELTRLRDELSTLESERARLRADVESLNWTTTALTTQLQHTTARLHAIEASRSWRWTALLRTAGSILPSTSPPADNK